MSWGGAERERETQNPKKAWGSNPGSTRSEPEPKSEAQPTGPPRSPEGSLTIKNVTTLVGSVDNGEDHSYAGAGDIWEISTFYSTFAMNLKLL